MPRTRLQPRLYLDKKRRQWVIRDGGSFVRTGASEGNRFDAERRLAEYLVARKASEAQKRPSFVYFIECGDYIKIGYATSIRTRLASLAVATPYPLKVLATVDGDRHTEFALHTRFADAFHRGEWFRKTPELLVFIDQINNAGRAAA